MLGSSNGIRHAGDQCQQVSERTAGSPQTGGRKDRNGERKTPRRSAVSSPILSWKLVANISDIIPAATSIQPSSAIGDDLALRFSDSVCSVLVFACHHGYCTVRP